MHSFAFRHYVMVLLLLGLASSAAAVELKGQLVLGAYKPTIDTGTSRRSYWEIENGIKEVRKDRIDATRELAVVLVGSAGDGAGDRVEVDFSGGSIMPSTLVVRAGNTLQITNHDEVAHELYAEGLDAFAAEATSPKGRRAINLPRAGSWPLRDRLISHVRGHLHVLADLVAVAQLADGGRFVFGDVSPGTYTLKVFHGATELVSQQVEVGPKGLQLDPMTLTAREAN